MEVVVQQFSFENKILGIYKNTSICTEEMVSYLLARDNRMECFEVLLKKIKS